MSRVLAAPRALTLRKGKRAGSRNRYFLGAREVSENAELLVQMARRTQYVTGPGYGHHVCTEVDWLPVRMTYKELDDTPAQPKDALVAGGRLLCLSLPFRCGGRVVVPALKTMQFSWPGPTATRAA